VLVLTAAEREHKRWVQKREILSSTTTATVFHSVFLSVFPVLVDINITVVFLLCYRLYKNNKIPN